MSYQDPDDLNGTPWFGFILLGGLFLMLATCGAYLEDQGLEREPTAKAKLTGEQCACVIQVDSVPIPEDILEVG